MLVLTRKVRQRIWINENIVVEVVRIDGRAVKIGIEAPQTVRIERDEVRRRGEDTRRLDSI